MGRYKVLCLFGFFFSFLLARPEVLEYIFFRRFVDIRGILLPVLSSRFNGYEEASSVGRPL